MMIRGTWYNASALLIAEEFYKGVPMFLGNPSAEEAETLGNMLQITFSEE
jgi:hypothetical protein